jgi:hypothetical protein
VPAVVVLHPPIRCWDGVNRVEMPPLNDSLISDFVQIIQLPCPGPDSRNCSWLDADSAISGKKQQIA